MFGEYAQVASYIQPARNAAFQNDMLYREELPAHLCPSFYPPQPWSQGREKTGLFDDFIMIAEFSELEGPKPLMTIPKDGGADFDQNTFAVRILAVDHQNPTDGFSISEDAQVVICDTEANVFAFVHHLVLYDNTARGFVRPYCIAFITTDQRKLMCFYEELSRKLKKVARFLKYGNKMVFVGDLERHLKDLEYTKNVLLNQVGKIRLRNTDGPEVPILDIRKNAENELYRGLQTIQQSSQEIKEILSVLKPLLSDKRLEAKFRLLEERAHQGVSSAGSDKLSLPESGLTDFFAVDELDTRYGSLSEPRISPLALFKPREYRPVLVETKKAKRFNVPLRGLHELCSWGAKEGLKKLRYIHLYFKRDMCTLELEKNESRLFRPYCTSLYHGHCIAGNFLSGVHMKMSVNATEAAEQEWSVLYSYQRGSLGSLVSQDSFKSADSSPSVNGLTEASPSSFHTYDSQNGHIYQSVSTSPDGEFSLLMSNEYYPDLKSGKDQEVNSLELKNSLDLPQNTKAVLTVDMLKAVAVSASELFQEQLLNSFGIENNNTGDAKISDIEAVSSLEVAKLISAEEDLHEKCTIPVSNQNFSSNINLDMNSVFTDKKITGNEGSSCFPKDSLHTYDNYSSFKEFLDKTNNVSKSNTIEAQSDSTEIVAQKSKDVCVYEDNGACFLANNNQNGCYQGRSVTTHIFVSSFENSVHTNEENGDQNLADRTTPSLSFCQKCPCENSHTLGGVSGVLNERTEKLVPREFKTFQRTGSEDSLWPVTKSEEPVKTNKIKQCDSMLSLLLEQEQKQRNDNKASIVLGSSLAVHGIPQIGHEDPQTSLSSVNESPSSKTLVDRLQAEIENELVSENSSSNRINTTLFPVNDKFVHHITRIPQLVSEKSSNSELNQEDDLVKARAESDASSAFTEISLQDLYSHPLGVWNEHKTLGEEYESTNVNEEYSGMFTSQSAASWKPRCNMYTVGDWVNSLTYGRPGFGLSEVFLSYQCLDHVIFSLMCGRPVLVAGSAKMEHEVIKVVNALTVFVPARRRKSQAVLEWTSKPLRITDLIKLKLIGVCRPDRRSLESFIPGAIKKACTVLDIEKRTIVAPPYQGQFITALTTRKKVLKSDVQLVTYIGWWLMDILAKAFIFFHSFCLGSDGSILYSHSPRDQRDAYLVTVSRVMAQIGVRDCDCEIIEHLVELVKLSKLEPQIWTGIDPGSVVSPLTLQQKVCEKFRC